MAINSQLLVATTRDQAQIRIVHRADCRMSPDVEALISRLRDQGFRSMILDLSECRLMDSTFLGMLAGFEKANGKPALPPFGLFQPSRKILDSLADLDLEHCFREIEELAPTEEGFRDVPLERSAEGHENLALHSLRAHRKLMSISPSNASRFRKVEEFLSRGVGAESEPASKDEARTNRESSSRTSGKTPRKPTSPGAKGSRASQAAHGGAEPGKHGKAPA